MRLLASALLLALLFVLLFACPTYGSGPLFFSLELLLAFPVLRALVRRPLLVPGPWAGALAVLLPLYLALALFPTPVYEQLVVRPLCGGGTCLGDYGDFGRVYGHLLDPELYFDPGSGHALAVKLYFLLLAVLAAVLLLRHRALARDPDALAETRAWWSGRSVAFTVGLACLLVSVRLSSGRNYEHYSELGDLSIERQETYGWPFAVSEYDTNPLFGGRHALFGGLLGDALLAAALGAGAAWVRARRLRERASESAEPSLSMEPE